jgi:hypothetical protein
MTTEATLDRFEAVLTELVREHYGDGAIKMLAIPGVYEAVSEDLNNEVVARLEEGEDEDPEPTYTCARCDPEEPHPDIDWCDRCTTPEEAARLQGRQEVEDELG